MLAATIQELMAEPALRSTLSANAVAHVTERSFDAAAIRLLDAIGLRVPPLLSPFQGGQQRNAVTMQGDREARAATERGTSDARG